MIVDWKSCRSQRVCRSTLASESCAADEASDRSSYVNMFLGEIFYDIPAHKVGCPAPQPWRNGRQITLRCGRE